ncbi:MAG: DUF4065 domain-containing protein [Oscillospiraceae bacterium]|jgi:uncharacterized phage-associated protein|nr:DUF4065 domain-containing protein [Oscillospiraceae bacterium]
MATVFDVAKYIIRKMGEITAMKLQKLCYYTQVWTLAWDGVPLFSEDFQAWADGPVCVELFARHKGRFLLREDDLDVYLPDTLTPEQLTNIDIVLKDYGDYQPFELSDMTHQERPWREARGSTPIGERCENIISKENMRDYYAGLLARDV